MQFMDDSLLPENQDPLVIQVAPYGPELPAARFRRHRGVDGGPGPEGGRLLQCGCDRASRPRPRAGRQGLQAARDVQRDARPSAHCGAEDDPAGRRLDQLRAEGRRRSGQVARRRHTPHARRAGAGARPGDHRDQHQPDERDGAHHRRRCRGHFDGRAGLQARLYRDVLRERPGLREGASQAPRRRGHPAALHDRIDQGPRDGRADCAPGPVYGPLRPQLGGDRRRPRRAEPPQPDGIHQSRSAECRADGRGP